MEVPLLETLLLDMVKMSPLQGSAFEVIDTSDEVAIVGATIGPRLAPSQPLPGR